MLKLLMLKVLMLSWTQIKVMMTLTYTSNTNCSKYWVKEILMMCTNSIVISLKPEVILLSL